MKKEWIELLHRSFEEDLNQEEATQLEEALKGSSELQEEKEALLKTRALFTSFSLEKDENFVANVMEAIDGNNVVAKREIGHYLSQIFPITVAACLLILLSFVTYIYVSEGNLDTESLMGMNDLTPEEAYSLLIEE